MSDWHDQFSGGQELECGLAISICCHPPAHHRRHRPALGHWTTEQIKHNDKAADLQLPSDAQLVWTIEGPGHKRMTTPCQQRSFYQGRSILMLPTL